MLWLLLLVPAIADLFERDDISGTAKAIWFLLMLVLPFAAVVVYVVARGGAVRTELRALWRPFRQQL